MKPKSFERKDFLFSAEKLALIGFIQEIHPLLMTIGVNYKQLFPISNSYPHEFNHKTFITGITE